MKHYHWVSQSVWEAINTGNIFGGLFAIIILGIIAAFTIHVVVYLIPIIVFIFVCVELSKHCDSLLLGIIILIITLAGCDLYYNITGLGFALSRLFDFV